MIDEHDKKLAEKHFENLKTFIEKLAQVNIFIVKHHKHKSRYSKRQMKNLLKWRDQ